MFQQDQTQTSSTQTKILYQYYEKYFADLSQIEEINHIPDEVFMMFQEPGGSGIMVQEKQMGISFSMIQTLYPLCISVFLNKNSTSEDLNIASTIMVFLNGENNTAWNIRIKHFQENQMTSICKIEIYQTFDRNLERGIANVINMQKIPEFINRVQQTDMSKYLTYFPKEENQFFKDGISKKNRNYNLWTYRLQLVKNMHELSKNAQYVINEIDLMKELAGKEVHNNCLFHHLMILNTKFDGVVSFNQRQEVLKWAIGLRQEFVFLYQDQPVDYNSDVDVLKLESLNKFIQYLSKIQGQL